MNIYKAVVDPIAAFV